VLNRSIDNGEEEAARASTSAVARAPVQPEELVRERVRRFMKLLPEVLSGERVEAIHDLRVWSRRLQQVLVTMFPRDRENRAGSIIRSLRRARRGLSGWRDCDVLIALVDRRLRRLRNSDEQRAWRVVHAYLVKRREKEINRARCRLAQRKLFILGQRTEQLLKQREMETGSNAGVAYADFIARVAEFIKAAYTDWQAALTRAAESASQADTHNFRIKTKQLRYRMELARDLGDEELLLPLNWLKSLQDSLGQWHDRAELARFATVAIADADFLLNGPRPASLLLKRLARELSFEAAKMKSLLTAVKDGGERTQLEAWIANHSGGANSSLGNQPNRQS
jgi:CHAD domain-containing protein